MPTSHRDATSLDSGSHRLYSHTTMFAMTSAAASVACRAVCTSARSSTLSSRSKFSAKVNSSAGAFIQQRRAQFVVRAADDDEPVAAAAADEPAEAAAADAVDAAAAAPAVDTVDPVVVDAPAPPADEMVFTLQGPEPQKFGVAEGQLADVVAASGSFLTRAVSGALCEGWTPSIIEAGGRIIPLHFLSST